MGKVGLKAILTLGACLAIDVGVAQADTPRDLRDLVGARGGQAENLLEDRGYDYVRTEEGSDRKWSYWWNDRTQTCVTIQTYEGRYSSITTSPGVDCGRSSGNRPGSGGYYPPSSQRPSYPPSSRPSYDNDGGYDDAYDRGASLTLICYGEGRRPASNYRSGYVWNPRSGRYQYRGFIENGTQGFDSEVQIELRGGRGFIHLSGKMVPPINSRGDNGWWDLRDVLVSRDQITASYRLNGLNKPRIRIDRRSGRINISGLTNFRGDCDVGGWNGGNRF